MQRACFSVCASCSVGDLVCQTLNSSQYDARRTAGFAASGLFVLGPLSYAILSHATVLVPGSSTRSVVARIATIQAVEPLRLGSFLAVTVLFSGRGLEEAIDKVRADTLPTTVRSWAVFTPFLFLTFRFMRPENRVPLMACVGACWNSYMSWVSHRTVTRQVKSSCDVEEPSFTAPGR